jgi:hypothetical protein
VLLEGADDLLGERLEGAREHDALLGVDGVLDEHERVETFSRSSALDTLRSLIS